MKTKNKVRKARFISRNFVRYMDNKDKREGAKYGTWVLASMYLAADPGFDNVKKVLEERLLSMPRFRSFMKLTKFGGAFHEIPLEEIEWSYHLSIPEFAKEEITEEELMTFSGSVVIDNKVDLDINKPLWRIFLFPQMKLPNGDIKFGLVLCVNHAVADGVSLIGVLFNIVDNSPINPLIPMSKQKSTAVIQKRKKKPSLSRLTRTGVFFKGMKDAVFGAVGAYDHTTSLKNADDSKAGIKLMGNAEEIPLSDIKDLKDKFSTYGMSVNDILLTILSMTMKAYFEESGELKKKMRIRGSFPVSLQSSKIPLLPNGDPRNRWSPYQFQFVTDYKSPLDCLFKVKRQLDKAKVSPQVVAQYHMAKFIMATTPAAIALRLMVRLTSKCTSMLSNVPGPQETLVFAGQTIDKMYFHLQSPVLIYFGLLTYANQVSLSLSIDERLKVPPETLIRHWNEQYKVLVAEVAKYDDHVAQGGVIPKTEKQRKKLAANQV